MALSGVKYSVKFLVVNDFVVASFNFSYHGHVLFKNDVTGC